ncbi:MAG: hypothetical protein IJX83_05840 [Lachnospiraceae bacterium]|nr:hypothetical protein [Lachnospiraceae bacterium]
MTQKDYYDFREEGTTRQVSLEKLLRCALRKWKLILLAGIILGAFFGSYKIFSIHSKKDEMIKSYETYKNNLEMYNTNISDYNKSIAEMQSGISNRLEYMQTAPAMQIDPYNCPIATAQIRVVPAGENGISDNDKYSLLYSIYDDIYYGDTSMIVAEKQNMNAANLNELLYLRIYPQGGTMTVIARGVDEAHAESIRDDLLDVVMSRKDLFSNFGSFDIEVYGKGTQTVVEPNLKAIQEASTDSLSKMQTSLRTSQNQLSQLVKPASVPQYSKKFMLKNGIKLGIVGFAGGACLMAIALICLVLYRGAILSTDEIDGEFGLRTLADYSDGKSQDEAGLDYMLARLESCTAGMDNKEIGIAGTISGKKLNALAEKLNKQTSGSKNGLSFTGLSNIAKDAESYRKLRKMNGVIIAEEVGRSSYNEIRNEIGLIADSGAELLGTVYF